MRSDELADKHVARSLSEMTDEAKVATWQDGQRAAEQADEILQPFINEALEKLEKRK